MEDFAKINQIKLRFWDESNPRLSLSSRANVNHLYRLFETRLRLRREKRETKRIWNIIMRVLRSQRAAHDTSLNAYSSLTHLLFLTYIAYVATITANVLSSWHSNRW